jgi:hypothetical protein
VVRNRNEVDDSQKKVIASGEGGRLGFAKMRLSSIETTEPPMLTLEQLSPTGI